jgi:hypothetical protein
MFDVAGKPLRCVGFSQSRGETTDSRARKRARAFGHFCRSDGQPMSEAEVEA